MKKMFNKAVLNGATVVGDGLTYPRIPNVYTGDNEGGYQRGDMMDVNAVIEMIKELTDTGEITTDELQNLINEEIQERVEGDQDQQRYTDEKIKDLIGTSPETLDTLKEIADALGEDPDFAANVWEKLAEVDQTLEDYKRASNLPKYVMASGEDSELLPISFVQDANGIHLNVDRTDLDTGDVVSTKLSNAIPNATTSMPGLMSDFDKVRVNRMAYDTVTNIYALQDNPFHFQIKYIVSSLDTSSNTYVINIEPATQSEAGIMTASDKRKLDSLVNYQAGEGIDITGDTISCTLDTSLYSIVTELPETGLPNKIYLLPSTKTEEGNIYTEYGYVDNKWEELGKYKADVDLSPYGKALNLPSDVIKALGVQSGANYVNVYSYKQDLTRGRLSEVSEFDIPNATSENAGIITAQDKTKLDGIEAGAQVNKIESVSVNGTPLEITNKGVNIPNATTEQDGTMSKADKTKLDSLENYTLPAATTTTLGGVKVPKTYKPDGYYYDYKNELEVTEEGNLILKSMSLGDVVEPFGPQLGLSIYARSGTVLAGFNLLNVAQLNTHQMGVLAKSDFDKFNAKQDALTEVQLNNINNAITSISVNDVEQINTNGTVNLTIPNATSSKTGLMSADDKSKLDSIIDWSDDNAGLLPIYNGDGSDGEWIYTHWIGAGQGTDNTWRKASDIILENITSNAILNNTPIATTVKAGLMSASDKTKLNSPINYYYRDAGVDTKLTDLSTDVCYIGSPVLEILGNKVEFKGAKLCTFNGIPFIDCSVPTAVASLLNGLMSKEDKAKLDSQPTIKANDATGVTDDDYVVIKKSEYQSILDRLSALEGNV